MEKILISKYNKYLNFSNEHYYHNNKNAYDKIFIKNKATFNIFENYFNNNLNKQEYYGTIEDYYCRNMHKNNLYNVLYNYIPGNMKQFKTLIY